MESVYRWFQGNLDIVYFICGLSFAIMWLVIFFKFRRRMLDIARLQEEIKALNQNYMVQGILNELLKISLEDISLEEMLKRVIARIVSIPWLSSEPKGGIFLVKEPPNALVLAAQQGLPTETQTMCACVPFGKCLCGRAALSGEIEFAGCIDERHENRYEGMPTHGHYCVPIISGDKKILGVINLYLKEGHRASDREKELLNAIADVLASVIERKKMEEALQIAYTELKETQFQLIHAERIEAVGIMASGVAHEVRNPLGIIIQGVDYLGGKVSPGQKDVSDVLEMMKNNVKRADKIIRALIDFSRMSESHMQAEDTNVVLESALFLVQHISKIENIEIVKDFKEGLPRILADREKVEQVFVGVFLNAIQAMPNGGRLSIRSCSTMLDNIGNRVGRRSADFFKPGEEAVVVEVEDTGIGIPKQNLKGVFEPFFTTKMAVGGSGLGLSVASNIINMHKGLIEIRSEEGKGTNVIVILKIARGGWRGKEEGARS